MHPFIVILAYFLPYAIAVVRRLELRQVYGILALDFFLGWTGIGWVIALWWSLRRKPRPIIYYWPYQS